MMKATAFGRGDIAALKVCLDAAQCDRQHKEEYEALRRLCMQYPSRATTVGHWA
jgi:THO complex subunit 7